MLAFEPGNLFAIKNKQAVEAYPIRELQDNNVAVSTFILTTSSLSFFVLNKTKDPKIPRPKYYRYDTNAIFMFLGEYKLISKRGNVLTDKAKLFLYNSEFVYIPDYGLADGRFYQIM